MWFNWDRAKLSFWIQTPVHRNFKNAFRSKIFFLASKSKRKLCTHFSYFYMYFVPFCRANTHNILAILVCICFWSIISRIQAATCCKLSKKIYVLHLPFNSVGESLCFQLVFRGIASRRREQQQLTYSCKSGLAKLERMFSPWILL